MIIIDHNNIVTVVIRSEGSLLDSTSIAHGSITMADWRRSLSGLILDEPCYSIFLQQSVEH